MNITEKKAEIISEIDRIDDEKLLWAVARLLHLDDELDIPDWHKDILQKREEKYGDDLSQFKDWEDVKKDIDLI